MKAAIYLRVSTTDQEPETQGREVRAFVAARGWEVVETYLDLGISGARARRPALDQLLKDAWHGRFEAVVVWDLSTSRAWFSIEYPCLVFSEPPCPSRSIRTT